MVELLRPAQTKAEVEIVFQDLKGILVNGSEGIVVGMVLYGISNLLLA